MSAARSLWQVQHRGRRFPRLVGDVAADVVIVGAGVTGCACALRLAQGGAAVVVVEAGRAADGASGRNGGFASAGTGLGLGDAAAVIGMPAAVALQRATEAALDEMLAIAADRGEAGAVRRTGSLWLASAAEADRMRVAVSELAAAGVDCREAPELIPAPMLAHYPRAAVFPGDCELEPARWVRALAGAAAAAGARLHERSPALAIEHRAGGWRVQSGAGTATGRAVVVACDGLLPRLVPELSGIVYPVRGQMLATEPIPDAVITLPTHSDHGFVYARPTLDGRLAIGGCRWADLEAEYTDADRPTRRGAAGARPLHGRADGARGRAGHATAGPASWASRPTSCRSSARCRAGRGSRSPAATAGSGTSRASCAAGCSPTRSWAGSIRSPPPSRRAGSQSPAGCVRPPSCASRSRAAGCGSCSRPDASPSGRRAAVHDQRVAGDVVGRRRGEVCDRTLEVGLASQAPHRDRRRAGRSPARSSTGRERPVANQPGAIAFTPMPCRAHFQARSRVNAITAPLAEL